MKNFVKSCLAAALIFVSGVAYADSHPTETWNDNTGRAQIPPSAPVVPGVPGLPAVPEMNLIPIQKWNGVFDCGPTEEILTVIKGQYAEQDFIIANGVIQLPGPQLIQAPTILYFNPYTTTWSFVAHFENGFSCILFYGNQLRPLFGPPTGTPENPGPSPTNTDGKDETSA